MSFDDLLPSLVALRRDLHANPELGFNEHRTAARMAEELHALGLDVTTGVGGTGVVGTLRHGTSDRAISLRADMDALPIQEGTGLPYASRNDGVFHGCGHDGHMAMLLGAARQLARTRQFQGTVNFIFQPAEEGLGGARAMIRDGLFDRFPTDCVFALHNWPDLPAGTAMTRPGAIMAAADRFDITVNGRGGHAAVPHQTPDAILATSELVSQLNTVVARRVPPSSRAVLSVTRIQGGQTHNVLPSQVRITGTVRTFDLAVQDTVEAAIRQIAEGVGIGSGTRIDVKYDRYYPATINEAHAANIALAAANVACGHASMAGEPAFTSEDFAFMLQVKRGAYLWLGQGGDVPLHHPTYDFNDSVLGSGVAWFVTLAEQTLAVKGRRRFRPDAVTTPQ